MTRERKGKGNKDNSKSVITLHYIKQVNVDNKYTVVPYFHVTIYKTQIEINSVIILSKFGDNT
jgi:hypothetical protein